MQPMSHDVRRMFVWTLDRQSDRRARGDGRSVYQRSEDPVTVYFSIGEKAGSQTAGGYIDSIEIPAYINGRTKVSVGDCLGTSAERTYQVMAAVRLSSPYAQTQLKLREL